MSRVTILFAHAAAAAAAMLELPTQGSLDVGEPVFFVAVPDGSETAYVGRRESVFHGNDLVTWSSVDISKAQLVATPSPTSFGGEKMTALAADSDTVAFTYKHNSASSTFVAMVDNTHTHTRSTICDAGSGDSAGIALWGDYAYVASTSLSVCKQGPSSGRWNAEVGCTAIDIAILAADGLLGVVCSDNTVIFNITANQTHPEEIYRWGSGAQTNVAVAAMDGLFVVASVGTQTEVAVFSPSEDPPLRNTFMLPPVSCDQANGIAVAEINMNKTVFLSCSTAGIRALYIENVNASVADEYMAGYSANHSTSIAVAGDRVISVNGAVVTSIDARVLGYHSKSSGSKPTSAMALIAFAVVASSLLW
ncbi:hypothetical protein DIPPA_05709 [Diplonema papillatum]|nr:hypothetical protein DIPPA_05709 [Diplonema papillatum]